MIVYDIEQGTPEWRTLRAGIPTASNFSKIVTSKGEESKSRSGYALTLAAELFAGAPMDDAFGGSSYTERGKELEAEALALYQFQNDIQLTRVGFITTDDGLYGCSPDSLAGDGGLVEVKCLKSENHVSALLYYKKNGRMPTDYVQQTQGQILVTGRDWVDLFFYNPVLPSFSIRSFRDDAVFSGLLRDIPKLLSERDSICQTLRGV